MPCDSSERLLYNPPIRQVTTHSRLLNVCEGMKLWECCSDKIEEEVADSTKLMSSIVMQYQTSGGPSWDVGRLSARGFSSVGILLDFWRLELVWRRRVVCGTGIAMGGEWKL